MIAIIDYGMGNLRSVHKALEYLGYRAEITKDHDSILNASHVVLPGVGAFADAMKSLQSNGLDEVIARVVLQGKPFLGICLGMQLLFDVSYEGGLFQGLKMIPGRIIRIPSDLKLKVPHMGWNELQHNDDPLFLGLPELPYVYYVHSYHLESSCKKHIIATAYYGMDLNVAVRKENIYGLQFHPEKSGDAGLKILKNFGGMK